MYDANCSWVPWLITLDFLSTKKTRSAGMPVVYMCMYVCVCVCMCMCMCMCVCMYVCMYIICTHTCRWCDGLILRISSPTCGRLIPNWHLSACVQYLFVCVYAAVCHRMLPFVCTYVCRLACVYMPLLALLYAIQCASLYALSN